MEGQHFDDLCRGFAVPGSSRRRVLGGLASMLGGGAALWLVGPGARPSLSQPAAAPACNDGAAIDCSKRVWEDVKSDLVKCLAAILLGPLSAKAMQVCSLFELDKGWTADVRCREDQCKPAGVIIGECFSDPARGDPDPTKGGTCCTSGMRAHGGVCYPQCPDCEEGDGSSCKPCARCKTCRGGLLGRRACLSVDRAGVLRRACGPTACCSAQEYCCNNDHCCPDASRCCAALQTCCPPGYRCCRDTGCCAVEATCCDGGALCCDETRGFYCVPGENRCRH
jgi:hypothetical protein